MTSSSLKTLINLKNLKKASLRRRRGQGMTEYIIIVGLISIVLVTAVGKFKTALGNAYGKATEKVDKIAQDIGSSGGAAPAGSERF